MDRPKTEGELPVPKCQHGSCPFCGKNHLVKAGKYCKLGHPKTQRYQCTDCHRFTIKPVIQLSLINTSQP